MYRDRTNLFLSYHRTFPHQRSGRQSGYRTTFRDASDPFLDPENAEDLEEGPDAESHPMIEILRSNVGALPPNFFDLNHEIDNLLLQNDSNMIQLTKLYRKNALPGFEDKTQDEKLIEETSYRIISNFQRCYSVMKKLQTTKDTQFYEGKQLQKGDLVLLDNCCKIYAGKIQASSNKFRVMQNNYLKFLNNDDFKPLPSVDTDQENLLLLEEEEQQEDQQEMDSYSRQTLMKQRQKHKNTRFLEQRDEEITKLAKGVLEVSTIFREMQALIIDQGTVIDRIDYNLENTNIELKQAQRELNQATSYQKRSQKCKFILLLSLVVLCLFFFVMLKPRGSGTTSDNSKSTEKTAEDTGAPTAKVI